MESEGAQVFSLLHEAGRTYDFEPLQVEFTLDSPVLMTYPWISLDGYLAYETGADLLGEAWTSFQGRTNSLVWDALPVPLARIYDASKHHFFYQASIGRFDNPGAVTSRKYQKMFCSEGIAQNEAKKAKYMIVGGQFKLRSIQYPANFSRHVTFWCSGDYKCLLSYCNNITSFGTRTAAGNGRISDCSVARISEDSSLEHSSFGLNRPIPAWHASRPEPKAMLATKPPYWAKENIELCYVPGGF